jgi:hypothetical protein
MGKGEWTRLQYFESVENRTDGHKKSETRLLRTSRVNFPEWQVAGLIK